MSTANAPEHAMSSKLGRAFVLAQRAANRVLRRRFRVIRLTKEAYRKLGKNEGAMGNVARDLHTMLRLSRAWARRDYRDVPWKALVFIVAAVVYFVNPIDVIPDVLTGLGFVDDAAVVGAVVRAVHDELAAFREWERADRPDELNAAEIPSLSAAA